MATTEVGETITPPNVWWTVEDELTLTPGTWEEVANTRFYTEDDAIAFASKRARDNFTNVRIVKHTA